MAVCCVRNGFAIAWVACLPLAAFPEAAFSASVTASCPEATVSLENVEAAGARDGTTILLKDGREIRLAGVVATGDVNEDKASADAASSTLNSRVAGKYLVLYGRGTRDRYGRLMGQVAVAGEEPRWLQADLVSAGLLRVAPELSEAACTAALLDIESKAREAQRGFWKEPRFQVEKADHIEGMIAAMGRFAVVEGVIHRVGETSSRTYLDFGRRYNEDFTIVIPRSARAEFAAAGIDLRSLRGKHVRVRGVLFSFGGPAIEIHKPASLEVLASGGT
jgi:endonuclease YncB( thermonuclease family)